MTSPPPAVPAVGLIRIDHVGLAVPDLDAAVEFYERVFNMRCVHTESNHEQGVREAMLAVGPDQNEGHPASGGQPSSGGQLQLLAPLTADSPIARFLDRRGPGVQQVAYTVADLDVACAALRAHGLRLLYDTARRGTAGSLINFVHPQDAGGVLVELVQPVTRSGEPAAARSPETGRIAIMAEDVQLRGSQEAETNGTR